MVLLGVPFAAVIYHYVPYKDYVIKTPITEYELKGTHLQYRTSFHSIAASDLVQPFESDETHVNIHVVHSPDDTAYPYIIMPRGTHSDSDIQTNAFHLKGRIVERSFETFEIKYDVESLRLPKSLAASLSKPDVDKLRAVWHVRKNGHTRFVGLEIDGESFPYQFSLNDVLVGRTQNRAKIIPSI